jgi:hypothetical protein
MSRIHILILGVSMMKKLLLINLNRVFAQKAFEKRNFKNKLKRLKGNSSIKRRRKLKLKLKMKLRPLMFR